MRIFLCGGGSGKEIEEATIKFGSLIDKSKPLLYIPQIGRASCRERV